MKHYERILACLLSAALIVGIFPTTAVAHSSVDSIQGVEDAAEGKADLNSEPYALLELREKRDRNTKYFLMSDGSTRVATYPVPVHFLDENHEWQDYDNTLSETDAVAEDNPYCNTDYANRESDVAVRLSKKTNGKKFVRLEIGGCKISWYYRGPGRLRVSFPKQNMTMISSHWKTSLRKSNIRACLTAWICNTLLERIRLSLGLCPKMKHHPLCGWIFIDMSAPSQNLF